MLKIFWLIGFFEGINVNMILFWSVPIGGASGVKGDDIVEL